MRKPKTKQETRNAIELLTPDPPVAEHLKPIERRDLVPGFLLKGKTHHD